MDRATYDSIVHGVVLPVGAMLQKRHRSLNWQHDWENRLFNAYEVERLAIRKSMGLTSHFAEHRIDRHKIAAALTRGILNTSPLVPEGIAPSTGARLANQMLALLSSMIIVMRFVEARLAQSAPTELVKIKNVSLKFPPANDQEYVQHACKALYHAKNPDTLILANIFFLLESFHLQHCGVSLLPVIPSKDEILAGEA